MSHYMKIIIKMYKNNKKYFIVNRRIYVCCHGIKVIKVRASKILLVDLALKMIAFILKRFVIFYMKLYNLKNCLK